MTICMNACIYVCTYVCILYSVYKVDYRGAAAPKNLVANIIFLYTLSMKMSNWGHGKFEN